MTLQTGRHYRVYLTALSELTSFVGCYLGAVELAGAVRGHEFTVDSSSPRRHERHPILLVDEIRGVEELADSA